LDRLAAGPPARRPARRLDGVRGRLNTVTLSLVAVLTAAAAAAAVTFTIHYGGSPDQVRVSDATGRMAVKVPAGFGRELRDSGWDPGALGLGKGHEPGLVVADDLTRWPDLGRAVDGVFVGVSEHGDVTAKVKALAHTGCSYSGSRSFADADWHGLVRAWSGCPDGGSVTETALSPAHGAAQPQVYVQVRQRGTGDATEGILRSLSVS
ncbi:serine/threonine protein kinase, partial [Streptomyces sp. NPDC001093]